MLCPSGLLIAFQPSLSPCSLNRYPIRVHASMGLGCNVEKSKARNTSPLHARQAEGRASTCQSGADGCSSRPCGLRECPSPGRSARGCSSRRAVVHTAICLPRRHCRLRPAPAAARRACGNSYTAGFSCMAWAAPHGRQQPPPVHPITDQLCPTQQAAAAAPGGWGSSSAASRLQQPAASMPAAAGATGATAGGPFHGWL